MPSYYLLLFTFVRSELNFRWFYWRPLSPIPFFYFVDITNTFFWGYSNILPILNNCGRIPLCAITSSLVYEYESNFYIFSYKSRMNKFSCCDFPKTSITFMLTKVLPFYFGRQRNNLSNKIEIIRIRWIAQEIIKY